MSIIIKQIEEIINTYNKDRMKNFHNKKTTVRSYIITKLLEEFGEYCEIAGMDTFLTDRKALKYNLLTMDGKLKKSSAIAFINLNLYKESGDLVWMALSLAFLEGHTITSLCDYLETRKDTTNRTSSKEK